MVLVVSLLNTRYQLYENVRPDEEHAILEKIIGEGNRLEYLYGSTGIEVIVDDEGKLKPNMLQNETLAYLMFGLTGFSGLLYGPAAIICRDSESEIRLRNWIKLLAADWIPETDKYLKDWWKQELPATRHALECIERDKPIPELQEFSDSDDD